MELVSMAGAEGVLAYVCGQYFSSEVWERGYAYAQRGHVLSVERSYTGAAFSVRSSQRYSYQVFIADRIEAGVLNASCSCGCDYPCKHMAAAILIGFSEDVFIPDSDWVQTGAQAVRHPVIAELDRVETSDAADSAAPPVARVSTEKTYLPYLLLESSNDYAFPGRMNVASWRLDLFGRYLKKDGSPGGYYRWKPGMRLVQQTPQLAILLAAVMRSPDRRLHAGAWLRWVIDEGQFPLLVAEGSSRREVSVDELQHIEVEFSVLADSLQEKFSPLFNCISAAGTRYAESRADHLRLIPAGPVYYLLDRYNMVLFDTARSFASDARVDVGEFMRVLLNCPVHYTRQDAVKLQRGVAGEPGLGSVLRVFAPPREEDLPCGEPVFRLYIDTRHEPGTSVTAMVDYGQGELPPGSRQGPWRIRLPDGSRDMRRPDYAGEQEFLDKLADVQLQEIPGSPHRGPSYRADIPRLQLLQQILQRFEREIRQESLELLLNHTRALPAQAIRIETSSGIDWLGIHAYADDEPLSLQQIDSIWNMLITRSGFRIIRPEVLESLRALEEHSLGDDSLHGGEIRIHHLDIAAADPLKVLLDAGPEPPVARGDGPRGEDPLDRLLQLREQLDEVFSSTTAPPAAGFCGELRAYQQMGLRWLRFLKTVGAGGILADDMGLGKTIQAIALLADYRAEGCTLPALVLAPVSTLNNWGRELERFMPDEPVYLHAGTGRSELPDGSCTILCSYQTMLRDLEQFRQQGFSLIMLDEGQQFKNPRTKLHAAVVTLQGEQKLILSGTPMENSIMDLWALMRVVNPGLLYSRKVFKRRYGGAGASSESMLELQQRIRPFFLRRTKELIAAELPGKREIQIAITHSTAEATYYRQLESACREKVRELLNSPAPWEAGIAILQTLTHLRQAAIAPQLVGGPRQSAKLDTVADKLAEAASEGHSVLVFSQFVRVLELIQERLDRIGLEYAYLDGSCTAAQRTRQIDSFRQDSRIQVFLLSLKAGGVGINLTEADYVCIVDPWWNPAVESQAIDRSHRIGQTKQVLAMRFIVENSIEERVCELQQHKQEQIDSLFGSGESLFSSLDSEDILQLFGSD